MRLTFGNLSLECVSRGGDRTWFRLQPPGVAFDVGRGSTRLAGVKNIFVTHGHLDHLLGLPFVLSYRARHGGGGTRIGCPRPIAEELSRWLEGAARLEASEYDYELIPMDPGDRIELEAGLAIEAFATDHVVPSLGYHLIRTRKRLAQQYRELPRSELARLRAEGAELEEARQEDWVSYCGDTTVEVLRREPRLLSSRILILECTFLAPEHRDRAGLYGHVHVDDLAEFAERFANESLVLCHLSRRHSVAELKAAVEQRLAPIADRVEYAVE